MTDEKEKEQPQVIIINTGEQVKTLIHAGELAKETERYDRTKRGTKIFIGQGRVQAPLNPTLAEFLHRAEKIIINERMPDIINKAKSMIDEELTNIRELLK